MSSATTTSPPKPSPPTTTNGLADLTASRTDGKAHLLLAASGSVATIKLPQIATSLLARHTPARLSIRLLLTSSAARFLAGQSPEQPPLSSLLATPGVDGIYLDDDEWGRGATVGAEGVWTRGSAVLHIELRRWADVLAVVPLSANTLAKFVAGLCDNLLTSVVRAWDADGRIDGRRKRILVAPAMNVSRSRFIPLLLSPELLATSRFLFFFLSSSPYTCDHKFDAEVDNVSEGITSSGESRPALLRSCHTASDTNLISMALNYRQQCGSTP